MSAIQMWPIGSLFSSSPRAPDPPPQRLHGLRQRHIRLPCSSSVGALLLSVPGREDLLTPRAQCVACFIVSCANKTFAWDLGPVAEHPHHTAHYAEAQLCLQPQPAAEPRDLVMPSQALGFQLPSLCESCPFTHRHTPDLRWDLAAT